jgi:hypothetical protein
MVLRWTAAGMANAQRSFRPPKGYKQRPNSPPALHPHAQPTVIGMCVSQPRQARRDAA